MISVAIMINGNCIMARSAVKTEDGNYKCDDGTIIEHVYEDGAIVLVKKLLDTIKR